MYGYTYRTTCRMTGRVYIGQKKSVFDLRYLGSGTRIRRAIAKHGRQQFEVEMLDTAENRIDLNRLEQKSIIEHRALLGRDKVMNITPGGEGCGKGSEHPSFGRKAPLEERQARSMATKNRPNYLLTLDVCGENNPMFGRHQTTETREKIAAKKRGIKGENHPLFGRTKSPEHCAAISAAKRGKPHKKGYKFSEEAKRAISARAKAKFAAGFKCAFTEETRRKISVGRKRYWAKKKGEVQI